MKERPVLFSAPMVRALLDGSKTQTRRAIKPMPTNGWHFETPPVLGKITSQHPKQGRFGAFVRKGLGTDFPEADLIPCPYGQPGDQLWVRETWMDLRGTGVEHRPERNGPLQRYAYRVDTPLGSHGDDARKEYGLMWKPSIHMPRAASRITLEITGVRVERLQSISESDCIAEGIESEPGTAHWKNYETGPGWRYWESPKQSYRTLWESINGPGSWDTNPWAWCIEFKKVEGVAA